MRLMNEQENREGQPGSAGSPEGGEEKEQMVAEHESAAATPYQYGVGDELRMRREAMGKSVADVVEAVRIQRRYIEALEENRLEDLPGTVYALGFVRTYSDFLGLNGSEIVARFKDEAENLGKQVYVMPEPIEEGKVPTAAIFVLALVLAAVAYGVWYYFSNRDSEVVQQVPEVPARLETAAPETTQPAAPIEPPQAAVTAEGDQPPIAETPAPVPVAAAPAETPPSAPAPVVEAPVEAPAPAPAPVAETPVEQPASEPESVAAATPEPVVEAPAETPALPPVETVPAPSAVETVTLAPPADGAATPGGDASALTAEEVPFAPEAEIEPHEPRVYGQSNTDARIVITATEDTWVEVSDIDEARIFSRVLRAGDTYRVPVRDGMTFVTGNAGGLQIAVDGEVVPSLGPSGQVRRNVKLDPGLLKSGAAWP